VPVAARHIADISHRMNTGHRCMVHKFPTGLLPAMCHTFVPGFYFPSTYLHKEDTTPTFLERTDTNDYVKHHKPSTNNK